MGKKIDVDAFRLHMTNLANKAKSENNKDNEAMFRAAINLVEVYAEIYGKEE